LYTVLKKISLLSNDNVETIIIKPLEVSSLPLGGSRLLVTTIPRSTILIYCSSSADLLPVTNQLDIRECMRGVVHESYSILSSHLRVKVEQD